MDKLTILGLLIAVSAIFGGQFIEDGSASALLNLPAFIIVVGGSTGAVMLQSHASTFKKALIISFWIFKPPVQPTEKGIKQIVAWSNIARKKGLLGLEKFTNKKDDPFILKGLNLLVDGNKAEVVRETLYIELDVADTELLNAAKVFESMGGYAPTLGIVGAVLGLIHVMGNLSEPELLGSGIATAFVATVYGVGFANLLFLPVYHKLRAVIAKQSQYREMIIEGFASIANGQNPRAIESKLSGYIIR